MLNSIKLRIKKLICCSVLCLGVMASALMGVGLHSSPTQVLAQNTNKIVEDVTSTVFGNGHDFNVSTSDSPVSPSGWTKLESQSFNNDNIIKGVVNVETETDFDTEECGTSRPIMPIVDKDTTANPGYYKNLMINSNDGAGRLGYSKSSSFTLEENSFYRISVMLYTQKTSASDDQTETDARASIYLTGLVDEDDENYAQTKFEYITTLGAWTKYYFYIDTDEKKSVGMELWLGSKSSNVEGAVFFNSVNVIRYSEDAYSEQLTKLSDLSNDNCNIISLKQEASIPFSNNGFEEDLADWKRESQSTSDPDTLIYRVVDANTFSKVNDDLTITPPGTNCSTDNSRTLFMYNKENGYQAIESESFTIYTQTYYKLSFWAKSDCANGSGATVTLLTQPENTDDAQSATITTSTSVTKDSNKFRNDWTQYSFYIYGPATGSEEAVIQIWLGTKDSPTTGYVFIDDFSIEIIDYSEYSNNSSGSNASKLDLNNGEDKYTVTNSDFNKTENASSIDFYPAVPSGWTRSGDENTTTISGVVNTEQSNFDSILFPSIEPIKPGALPYTESDDNNVLMIGSSAEINSQTFTSNTLTLSADSYYSISFYVLTDYIRNNNNKNYGARVAISTSSTTVFDIYNIYYTNNDWHKIEIKIKTNSKEITPSIKLMFDNTTGYVFFDQVELRTITEAVYNDTTFEAGDTQYYRIDLSSNMFDNRTINKVLTQTNGIDLPNNWTANSEDTITSGIININNTLLDNFPQPNSSNESILYISSLHDTFYSYTSTEKLTFASSTYYKISVDILTNYISQEGESEDDIEFGASISLTDSPDIMIKGIKTNNTWTTYTIYASFVEGFDSAITLALGYKDEATSGTVLFDNLAVTTLTQDEYLSQITDYTDLSTVATFINYTEPKEEETTEESEWTNDVNWLVLPSIITALAIIIAVASVFIRKIKINRKPRIKTNYDRRKTLDKDIDRREKIALRKQIITELQTELSVIDQEINNFNELANKHLDEIKEQIKLEQEELEKQKLELEIRKKEATAQREKQLKESEDFANNKKAEKQYTDFISRIEKQELSIQKRITAKEQKVASTATINKDKLSRYLERKEYIKLQIAKIEAEIEEIARQEDLLWAEYRAAKEDAKRRKAEYKAQVKSEKQKNKVAKAKQKMNATSKKTPSKKPANKNK